MKRIYASLFLITCFCFSALPQSLDSSLIVTQINDSIVNLTVFGYGQKSELEVTHPIPYSIDIDANYNSISVSRNNLSVTYKGGQSILIYIGDESDTIQSPIRQLRWDKVFRDSNEQRHSIVILESNLATLEARLNKGDYSLLFPILGDNAKQYECDSLFYHTIKGESYDTFIDKGPLSLGEDNDSTYLYRIMIPPNWKKIDYSSYYQSVTIIYPGRQYIQLSYSDLIKTNSFRGINFSRVSKEEGRSISPSIKKHPRKNDVAAYVEGSLGNGRIHITVLAKKRDIDGILQTITGDWMKR